MIRSCPGFLGGQICFVSQFTTWKMTTHVFALCHAGWLPPPWTTFRVKGSRQSPTNHVHMVVKCTSLPILSSHMLKQLTTHTLMSLLCRKSFSERRVFRTEAKFTSSGAPLQRKERMWGSFTFSEQESIARVRTIPGLTWHTLIWILSFSDQMAYLTVWHNIEQRFRSMFW